MSKAQAKYTKEQIDEKIKPLREEASKIQRKISYWINKRNKLKTNVDLDAIKKFPKTIRGLKPKDWKWLLFHGQRETMEGYKFRTEFIRNLGFSSDELFPETEQFRLCIHNHDLIKNKQKILKNWKLIKEHYTKVTYERKYSEEYNGRKLQVIGILGEVQSMDCVLLYTRGVYKIVSRYMYTSEVFSSRDLEKVLDFILYQ